LDHPPRKPPHFASPYPPPWNVCEHPGHAKSALIIGAGISGCTTARRLANVGFEVTLIDREPEAASGASGNEQGILYSKPSMQGDAFSRFVLSSYLHSLRYYKNFPDDFQACGVMQLAFNQKEMEYHERIKDLASNSNLVSLLSATRASNTAGVTLEHSAAYYPQAGYIQPANICNTLVDHPRIQLITQTEITCIEANDNQWLAFDKNENCYSAGYVIVASGNCINSLEQTRSLPMNPVRGQVSLYPENNASKNLATVLCSQGYIAPSQNGFHSIGATYNFHCDEPNTREEDHIANLEKLATSCESLAKNFFLHADRKFVRGRAGFRATTPDYLPLCGPVPDAVEMKKRFAQLSKNGKADIRTPGSYYKGLYVIGGMGSRGMSYAPLCAEVICRYLSDQPQCLPLEVIKALNPARFLIRDIIKSKN
jgi:tRNA 5-methylaminomethyl-2-thiouridine biosynthesis bifunctional protein